MSTLRTTFRLLLGLALGAATPAAAGQAVASHPFSPADLGTIRTAGWPRLSPDGRTVVFTVEEPTDSGAADPRPPSHLWRVPFDGSRPAEQLTRGAAGEWSPAFRPDGDGVAFLAVRGEAKAPQAWYLPLGGGEPRALTHLAGGVSEFAWSPDGTRLACIASDPPPAPARGDAIVGEGAVPPQRVWIVDARTGAADSIGGGDTYSSLAWSPDGRSLAALASATPRLADRFHARLVRIDLATRAVRPLCNAMASPPVRWSPDGTRVLCYTPLAASRVAQRWPSIVTVADGAVAPLAPDYPGGFQGGSWSGDGRSVLALTYTGVRAALARIDVAAGRVTPLAELLTEPATPGTYEVDAAGLRAVAAAESPARPAEIVAVTLPARAEAKAAPTRVLTDLNPAAATWRMGGQEVFHWRSPDGTPVEGLLFKPADWRPGTRYPTVVMGHGGPLWAWWYGWPGTWDGWAAVLSAHGYVVLCPNPRGSFGYGHRFASANYQDWGGGDWADIEAGTDTLIAMGLADSTRLGFGGWSYGGFLAAWALGHAPRYRAVVVGAGVTDYAGQQAASDVSPFLLQNAFGRTPFTDPAYFAARSPIASVARMKSPTLIVGGAGDVRVPVEQEQLLYRALREQGVPVEWVRYPREPHDLGETTHRVDVTRRVLEFFDANLRGAAMPAPTSTSLRDGAAPHGAEDPR